MEDSVTEHLIQLLCKDATQGSKSIAGQLGVSPATVRRRIKTLLKRGVIRIVAIINPPEGGSSFAAVIGISVVYGKSGLVTKALAGRPEVVWTSTTTGRFDVLTMVRFNSNEDLNDFIQEELSKMEGLRNSEIFICLHIKRGRYIPA